MLIGRERLVIGSVSALAVLVVESLDKPPKLIVEQCRKHVDDNEGPIVGRFVYTINEGTNVDVAPQAKQWSHT